MKKELIATLILLINLSPLLAQSYKVGHAAWADSLRTYLAIDSVYCRDSVVHFEAYDTIFQLHITKKRPNYNKALELIDSVSLHLDDDKTFARLVTILQEYDIKYLSEFSYTIDYFQNSYHISAKGVSSNRINELYLIERMERLLYFNYRLKQDSFDLLEFLIDEKNDNYKQYKPYSYTWERWGSFDLSLFINHYSLNKELYSGKLRELLIDKITEDNVYRIINRFGLFNHYDYEEIDCTYLDKVLNKQTSNILIDALDTLNKKFHKKPCLDSLLAKYRK